MGKGLCKAASRRAIAVSGCSAAAGLPLSHHGSMYLARQGAEVARAAAATRAVATDGKSKKGAATPPGLAAHLFYFHVRSCKPDLEHLTDCTDWSHMVRQHELCGCIAGAPVQGLPYRACTREATAIRHLSKGSCPFSPRAANARSCPFSPRGGEMRTPPPVHARLRLLGDHAHAREQLACMADS